ncbi:hypothetical protein [Bradyrhizobium sp. CB3481]|uniref:hypothetical protein n=1 Tax=Bradyrhizobium sp. CB3481 TaxID=3039158 RepID=UPI0024B0AA34|nr:hypothetical protein [Bradyrhizobium sp. CB3481]WFU19151.1 hypothetical protein QA643_12785 [Bradyrhizobium sp. CB3481]
MQEIGTTPWHSDESIERYNALFPILPDFAAHYVVGLKHGETIGLSDKDSLRLRRDLLAALVADKLGISLAYARRRYTEESDQSRWMGLTDTIDAMYREGREYLSWYISIERDQIPENDQSFRTHAINFFYRSLGSLDATKRLADLGYLCEAANILRSALEQFAYCSRLATLSGAEDFQGIKPIQCLNHLKRYVPAAGQLYGLMSKYTHFEYDHHTHFFVYSKDEVQTLQRGPVLRAYSTHLLFITMVCVAKYVLALSAVQFGEIPKSIQGLDAFIEKVDMYSDAVCGMLSRDLVLANMDILLQKIIRNTNV